jgi:hypothetical protein
LRNLINEADSQTSNNAFRNLESKYPDSAAEDLFGESALNEAYEYINLHVNENCDKDWYDLKLNAKAKAELELAQLVAGHTNSEMMQNRILHRLKESISIFSIRGTFQSALVGNRHLCDNVIRKLVLELNHGVWKVLQNCRNSELLHELIADNRLDQSSRKLAIKTRDELLEKQ